MRYTIYNQITGQISRIVETNEIELQLHEDESYIEGSFNDESYYVENNQAVEMPEKPSPYAEFDYTTKEWVLNSNLAIVDVLAKRRKLLTNSDWTDTLSAKTRLGDELYNQWQVYRQALRDITDQPGYPLDVAWPSMPQ